MARREGKSLAAAKVAACAALLGAAAVVLLVSRQGPASLLSASTDIDAPNSMDYAFMKKARGTQNLKAHFQDLAMKGVPSKQILQMQNHKLERQVQVLENEVDTLSHVLPLALKNPRAGVHQQMLAKAAGARQNLAFTSYPKKKRGLSHEIDVDSAYYSSSSGDPMGQALATEGGDGNWVADLKPGDYWKDPYERPFLHAPGPHDPASTLAHTVTGDYASPATWGEIYKNKEQIDWCTENFPWFEDRIKCIKKMHPQGPLLG